MPVKLCHWQRWKPASPVSCKNRQADLYGECSDDGPLTVFDWFHSTCIIAGQSGFFRTLGLDQWKPLLKVGAELLLVAVVLNNDGNKDAWLDSKAVGSTCGMPTRYYFSSLN